MNEEKKLVLGFIQDIISRLSQKSFLVKGWSISIAAFLGIMLDKNKFNMSIAIIICISIFIFWFLNAFYLQYERYFRTLYSEKVNRPNGDSDMLSLDVSEIKNHEGKKINQFWGAFFSKTVWPFHFTILAGAILLLYSHI
ncbi:hypothetical protein ACIPSG_15720 [Pectobacterium sp. CHL-2024]|uniref:hypothetical protein n=1 Tax=Pectobacterium sp. CHL-2024 TaxID=3377079 RepID=UPI0038285203